MKHRVRLIHVREHIEVKHPFHLSDIKSETANFPLNKDRFPGVYKTLLKCVPDKWNTPMGDIAHLFRLSTRECYRLYYRDDCDTIVAETRNQKWYVYRPDSEQVDECDNLYLALVHLRCAPVRK